MSRRRNSEIDIMAIIALFALLVELIILIIKAIPPIIEFIVKYRREIGRFIAECTYPFVAVVITAIMTEIIPVQDETVVGLAGCALVVTWWIFLRTVTLQIVSDVRGETVIEQPVIAQPVIPPPEPTPAPTDVEEPKQTLEKMENTEPVELQNCSKEEIMTLVGFNKTKAKDFIKKRDEGLMWYDVDSFARDFKLQPHEMIANAPRLIFPPKQVAEIGRTIDY